MRRFPLALDLLREGALHMTGLTMLAPLLEEANHAALLLEAKHRSKRDIERMIARLRPRDDVRDEVRRLPSKQVQPLGPRPAPATGAATPPLPLFAGGARAAARVEAPSPPATAAAPGSYASPPSASEERHAVRFTASQRVKQKIDRARALAAHRLPGGDLEDLFELALDALIEKLAKQREGAVMWPRATAPRDVAAEPSMTATKTPAVSPAIAPSRYVPRAVRREVYRRDGHQCTFTAPDGRRCRETSRLELHHVHAFALGGPTTVGNLMLRCRVHNAYEGELLFGRTAARRVR